MHKPLTTETPRFVIMGRVLGPLGVNGWIKLRVYTEMSDGLGAYQSWWLGSDRDPGDFKNFRETGVMDFAIQGGSVVARLSDCADRDAALALKGLAIAVPRALLPVNREGEYYWADMIGLAVVGPHGERLGDVVELLQTGSNDVLRVTDGKCERLIPFIASAIRDVDLGKRSLSVDWDD